MVTKAATDRLTELLEGRLDVVDVLMKYLVELTSPVLEVSFHCGNTPPPACSRFPLFY